MLASNNGDRLWWRIGQSEQVSLQLFSESIDTVHGCDGLREPIPFCGSSYCEIAYPYVFVWSG